MITLNIDGKMIKTKTGTSILRAAIENNINIPTLCYHNKLEPIGACRLCIVEIQGQNVFSASCATKTQNGMIVEAFNDKLENARVQILKYLLLELKSNNLDDLSYRCQLQELLSKYGITGYEGSGLFSINDSINYHLDDTSPVLKYDSSKCVKCFKCIRACDEIQGKNVLSFAGRGINKYIVAGFGVWSESECDGCGECIEFCPTGAIVEKPNLEILKKTKPDYSKESTCPYCGVGCRIKIKVKNNKIVRICGLDNLKPNKGRLCVKGRFGYDFVNNIDRLTKPLIKNYNGSFEEVSWDKAISFIASKFNNIKFKYGINALAGYSSAKCTNEDNYIFQKFIRIVFGNNNIDYCTRLCHASTVTAMIEAIGSGAGCNSIEDYEKADCIFIIGNNMIETHPVTATFVKRGVARGAKLIIIDPKWTPLVNCADIWLQPKLGTDISLINGMIKTIIEENLFDENFVKTRIRGGIQAFNLLKKTLNNCYLEDIHKITNVHPDMIRKAAKIYAMADKVITATGMGISQQLNGTNTVFSVLNLCLITGKIGKEGCGLNPPRGQNNVQGASDVGCLPMSYPGYISVTNNKNRRKLSSIWGVPYNCLPDREGLTTVEIIKAAYNGNIKGMYIMGENPMLSDPNLNETKKAFKKLDFLVVQDIFLTETAKYADVVLPATSFAEKNGTFTNSDRRVNRVRKAIIPPGEARQDWKIITSIAQEMGHSLGTYKNEKEIFNEISLSVPFMSGIKYDKIQSEGIQWPCYYEKDSGTGTLFMDLFNTNDGLASLNPVKYESKKDKTSADYPFLLNSGRILYHYHTGTMSRKSKVLVKYENNSYVLMNEKDVVKLALKEGQVVKIISRKGELETTIRVSNEVNQNELFMPFHYFESPVNMLTTDKTDPFSKIPPFKLTACRVVTI